MAHTEKTRARYGAVIVVIAPAVLGAGLVYHPHIWVLLDEGAVAVAVASDSRGGGWPT